MNASSFPAEWTYLEPNITNHLLDEKPLGKQIPLDHDLVIDTEASADLGTLGLLPLELLHEIFLDVDVRTLTDCRRVNHLFRETINGILPYRILLKHCPAAIRGVLALGLGPHITCRDLYKVLGESGCETCGDFGGFIHLLSCSRVCFLCVSDDERYFPLSLIEVTRRFGIPRAATRAIPVMKSIPGTYAPNEFVRKKRLQLVYCEAARECALQYYGNLASLNDGIERARSKRPDQLSVVDSGTQGDARRFMSIIAAPQYDRMTGRVERGFHCTGCSRQYRKGPLHWRRKYTAQTMKKHIDSCGIIVDGQHRSPEV